MCCASVPGASPFRGARAVTVAASLPAHPGVRPQTLRTRTPVRTLQNHGARSAAPPAGRAAPIADLTRCADPEAGASTRETQ